MTTPLVHPLLEACGVTHGFGVRGAPEPDRFVRPRQVHGAAVARVSPDGRSFAPRDADAIVTRASAPAVAVAVAVVTADCVPVLAASGDGFAVAAIHAGWRGLASGVVEAGIAALRESARGAPLVAAVGPRIGACCYEVDAPVVDALRPRFTAALDAALVPSRPGHHRLDLGALAAEALRRAGLAADAVTLLSDVCTFCHPERFHSYRRDGARAGRLLHFVRPRRTGA